MAGPYISGLCQVLPSPTKEAVHEIMTWQSSWRFMHTADPLCSTLCSECREVCHPHEIKRKNILMEDAAQWHETSRNSLQTPTERPKVSVAHSERKTHIIKIKEMHPGCLMPHTHTHHRDIRPCMLII